jgi:hypothetical protein
MREQTANEISREALHRRVDAGLEKRLGEVSKISAETSRINRETSTYPRLPILTATLGSIGVIAAIVTLITMFHK